DVSKSTAARSSRLGSSTPSIHEPPERSPRRSHPEEIMLGDTVSILEGDTFVVSNRQGDLDGTPTVPHGLFRSDTRFLSRWILTIDGQRPNALSVDDLHYFSTQFFLVPGTGTVYVDAPISVIRTREIGNGFHEEIRVLNHSKDQADLVLRLEAGA